MRISPSTARLFRATHSNFPAHRAAHLLDNTMGEALGKIYVAKYFPPEAKAKAVELVHNLLKAYEADIRTLDWMRPATKAKARREDCTSSRSRSAIPTSGATIRRSRSREAT